MDPLALHNTDVEEVDYFDVDENEENYDDDSIVILPPPLLEFDESTVKGEADDDGVEIIEYTKEVKPKEKVKKKRKRGVEDPLLINKKVPPSRLPSIMRKKKASQPFSCMFCPFTSMSRWAIVHHTNDEHEKITVECPHCQKEVFDLQGHIAKEHRERRDEPIESILPPDPDEDYCSMEASTSNGTTNTSDTNESDVINEILCEEGEEVTEDTFDEENFDDLDKSVYELVYKCILCQFSSKQHGCTETHFRKQHLINRGDLLPSRYYIRQKRLKPSQDEAEVEWFNCKSCDYKSNRLGNLQKHVQTKHDNKTEKCNICGNMYKNLNNHIKVVHMGVRNFPCPSCDYRSINRVYLDTHIKNKHTDADERQKCDVCGKMVKMLKVHIETMHGSKRESSDRIPCTYCDYSAKCKSSLKSHIQHMHEKILVDCNVCGAIVNKVKLKCHQKKHLDNQFSCLVCLGSYRERRDLARHILYQHKEIRSNCEFCNNNDVTDYINHVKYNHKEINHNEIEVPNSDKVLIRLVIKLLGTNSQYQGNLDPIEDKINEILALYKERREENKLFKEEDIVLLGFKPVDFHGPGSGHHIIYT